MIYRKCLHDASSVLRRLFLYRGLAKSVYHYHPLPPGATRQVWATNKVPFKKKSKPDAQLVQALSGNKTCRLTDRGCDRRIPDINSRALINKMSKDFLFNSS